MLAALALVAAGLPFVAAATTGPSPASADPAPAWTAYAVNFSDDNATPIATATNTTGNPIKVDTLPAGIAVTPNAKTAYAANNESNDLTPIDTATNTAGNNIELGGTSHPHGIAISPDGKTAYVAGGQSTGTVTPVDTTTKTVGTPIPVGSRPFGIAITPNGKTAYVANNTGNTVTPIATATNTAGTPIAVGLGPVAIAVTPNGKTAYVVNNLSDTVTPIDTATNIAGSPIAGVGESLDGIAITPDGKTAYVADSPVSLPGTVTPFDTATNTAGTPIAVGMSPGGIAITPDGKTAYVANFGSDNVTPIDTATNTAGTAIGVGHRPEAIAITPDQAPVAHLSVTAAHTGAPSTFDASASTVAFGAIASYAWNFGDGSSATTTVPKTTHTYASGGTFAATVTETSSGGTSTSRVFTGQTMSKNGGPSAVDSVPVTVPATAPPGAGVATSPQFGVPNQTDLFDVNNNGAVEVRWTQSGGAWNGPLVISPPGLAPPGADLAASAQFGVGNQTDVFVVGGDGATRVLWVQGAGAWKGPTAITPTSTGPPGAALATSDQFGIANQTDVFVVGGDGATRVSWVQGAGAWHGPAPITPTNTAPAGAGLAASNQFGIGSQTDVFVVGGDGATRVSWVQGAGIWRGPLSITPTNTAPAGAGLAASNQFGIGNQTDVFVVGGDGASRVSWVQDAAAWQGPAPITPTNTAPAGAALAASRQFGIGNQTDVFVVDNTGATRVSWVQSSGSWNGPLGITLAGNAPKGAHLAASAQFGVPKQTDLFVVDSTGSTEVSWVQSGAWQGPLRI